MALDRVLPAMMPLLGAAEAAAAVGAVLALRRDGETADPALAERLQAVLDAAGIGDALDDLDEHDTAGLAALVAGNLAQAADFAAVPGRPPWSNEDPEILLAQGRFSALLAGIFERHVLPAIGDGIEARMEQDGATFLDVGSGVGALSVALCRTWPALRVVGVDPWEPAVKLARAELAAAGMAERVELRQTTAEALDDEDAFDLAWVPLMFVSADVLEQVMQRVHASLRPGGTAIFGVYARRPEPLPGALTDLRTFRHGGAGWPPPDVAAALERIGYANVGVRFDPAWNSPLLFVTGQRAEAGSG